MPNIHSIIYNPESKVLKGCIAHYWVEFLVEYESYKVGIRSKEEFQESFISTNWNIRYFKGNRNDMEDMYWLMYTVPYFIGLCYAFDNFKYYKEKISDTHIKELCLNLYKKSIILYKEMPFDDYDKIKIFEGIFDCFWINR